MVLGILVIVILLGLLGAAIYHMWNIYQTRFATRWDMEESRGMVLMAEMKSTAKEKGESATPQTQTIRAQPVSPKQSPTSQAKPSSTAPAPSQSLRNAVLDSPTQLAYLSLKLELPDHEVLTQVDSAALFAAPLPIQTKLDFVVCHKRNFSPIAIITLQRANEDNPQRERILQHIARSGVRVVRWPANKPPQREQIRTQVLGTP